MPVQTVFFPISSDTRRDLASVCVVNKRPRAVAAVHDVPLLRGRAVAGVEPDSGPALPDPATTSNRRSLCGGPCRPACHHREHAPQLRDVVPARRGRRRGLVAHPRAQRHQHDVPALREAERRRPPQGHGRRPVTPCPDMPPSVLQCVLS